MSLIPRCTVCATALNPYTGDTRCARCYSPCKTCGGDVMMCGHALEDCPEDALTVTHGDPLRTRRAA